MKDPRGRNKSVGIGPILTLYTMGVAAGAKDLKAAVDFAKRLRNWQLKELGCPKRKDRFGNPTEGEYACPSYNAFYHLLTHGNPHVQADVADAQDESTERGRRPDPQARRRTDEGGRLSRLVP